MQTGAKEKKKNSMKSRVLTGLIALPILFSSLQFSLSYLILIIIVMYISYGEYYIIEQNLIKKIFSDQYSLSTSSTLLSSPIQKFIIFLIPVIAFLFKDSEIIAYYTSVVLMIIYRLLCLIKIYRINSNTEFDIQIEQLEESSKEFKMKNPMNLKYENENYNSSIKKNQTKKEDKTEKKINDKKDEANSNIKHIDKNYITEKMMTSTLIVIAMDLVYISFYAYPITFGVSMHHIGLGYFYISYLIAVSYFIDTGALIVGVKFGKHNFGDPITPSKTWEGIYGGIIFGIMSSFAFRWFALNFTKIPFFDNRQFLLLMFIQITTAIGGDFVESFIKRCGDTKDSGTIFPGHGGLLDRIDSLSFVFPFMYYFSKNINNINI